MLARVVLFVLRRPIRTLREMAGACVRSIRSWLGLPPIEAHLSRPETVLWQLLPHRHIALTAHVKREATAEHDDFLNRSLSYREAIRKGDDLLVGFKTDSVTIGGLMFTSPIEGRSHSLSQRVLQRKWLPMKEILASRVLAVGKTMIDIGANIGTTSIPRLVLGDFQSVYAVEPEPANYAALVQNIITNRLCGLILPDRVALGSIDGNMWMKLSRQIGGHHLLPQRPKWLTGPTPRHIEVPTSTLDAWVERMRIDLNQVTFIKCDTQGWEGHILGGAERVLGRKHIAWQVEMWPKGLLASGVDLDEVLDRLQSHFSHFIRLDGKLAQLSIQPTTSLRTNLKGYFQTTGSRRFINLLLYHA